MNRQQLYTLSGVLLASTALSGLADAATVKVAPTGANTFPLTNLTSTAVKIANTVFSTTATTADAINVGGGKAFAIVFTNAFTSTTKFSVEIDVAGAQFNTGSIGDIKLLVRDPGNSLATFANTVAATAACTSVTPLVGKLILDGCQLTTASIFTSGSNNNFSAAAGGIMLSGTVFNTANSLATVGNSIALSGSVYNSNNTSQSFETITSGNIITSAAPLTAVVTACGSLTADPTATPAAFDYFKASNLSGASGVNTVCLATVTVTSAGTVINDLSTPADLTNAATSVTVTVTDSILGSAAINVAQVQTGTTNSGTNLVGPLTNAAFSGGTLTFQLNTAVNASAFNIELVFTGSTPIPAAAAGTVSVAFGSGGTASVVAPTTASGASTQIARGGFNGELNTFLASTNTSFTSFARIHNMGVTAGTATITVLNDATGAQLGSSFTTATIASGQTLQLSNKDIETAAGITAASGVNYTVQITGPFIGYAQHIIFNPATGQLADLSGFRNHDAGSGNSP